MRAGICAAPHINARNDTDYLNWTRFVVDHPEIKHIAFEFGTGAGHKGRTNWHLAHLLPLPQMFRTLSAFCSVDDPSHPN